MINQNSVLQTIKELAAQSADASPKTRQGRFCASIVKAISAKTWTRLAPDPSIPVVPINVARDTVDRLVMSGKFGTDGQVDKVTPNKFYLDAVQDMQGKLRVYNEESDPGPAKDALGKEIEQALAEMYDLAAQAPEGEARNAYESYVEAAQREYQKPTPHTREPNISDGPSDPPIDVFR